MDLLRYGWPRKYLVKLAGWWPNDRLLDFLYPSNATLRFK